MRRAANAGVAAAFVMILLSAPLRAQTSITSFLPEVGSYFRLASSVRLVFDAKGYMEDGDLNHAQFGPSLQFNTRPLAKLKRVTVFALDDVKCVPVMFTIGYRYMPSTVQPPINRLQPIAQFHIPSPGRTPVTDRNRFDLDWQRGLFHWTYRNRVTAERRLTLRDYHPSPYAAAEFGYQSQFSKWTTATLFAGCLLPLTRGSQLDMCYEHVNNTGPHPNRQVNAAGVITNLYFPPYKG